MAKRRARWGSLDYWILIVTFAIVAYGLLMVFSASYYKAQSSALYDYDGLYLFKRQAVGAVCGTAAMLVLANMDYHKLSRWKYIILLAALGLLIAVFIPGVGVTVNGATRWVRLGPLPTIQPAEIAKFALIVMVSATIDVNRNRMEQFRRGILPNLLVLILMCILLYFQPNYSSVIMLCILVFIMMYVGGARGWQLALIAGVVGVIGFVLLIQEPYRVRRILSFTDPWADAQGDGHQVIQSLYGIGAGGFTGRGLGNSRQKFLWLPYGESDFIFAITAEEMGLVGTVALMGMFIFLVCRGMRAAILAPDHFGTVLATGITSLLGVQTLMNIAVGTASMPPTGVPMPLFSYGSTSLVVFMSMIGVLLNVSRQRRPGTVKAKLAKPRPREDGPRKIEAQPSPREAT